MAKEKAGRKPLLKTDRGKNIKKDLIRLIRAGVPNKIACTSVGISEKTFYTWIEKGEQGKAPYAQFQQSVKKARAEWASQTFMKIQVIANEKDNWQALAWALERTHPEEFALRGRMEVKTEATIRKEVKYVIDPAELEEVVRILRECGALEAVVQGQPDKPKELGSPPESVYTI